MRACMCSGVPEREREKERGKEESGKEGGWVGGWEGGGIEGGRERERESQIKRDECGADWHAHQTDGHMDAGQTEIE